jgi:hemerythrin-like domain-containing protein
MSAADKTLRTEAFRRQHREILDVVRQVEAKLAVVATEQDPSHGIRAHINELAGKLNVHLAMEDNALYPRVLQHGSPALQKVAGQLQAEMGGIKQIFSAYLARWSEPQLVQTRSVEFIRETNELCEALKRRIAREDNELYALLDLED